MERPAEVFDAARFAFLHEEIEHAVIDVALTIVLEFAYRVQQIVVDIVDLQIFERIVIHLHACLERLRLGREVREFGGNYVIAAFVSAQCYTHRLLRESLAIARRCVEIVHAVSQSIVDEAIDFLLVEMVFALFLQFLVDFGQTHHAVAQKRHLGVGIGHISIGHLIGRHLGRQGGDCALLFRRASGKRSGSDSSSRAHQPEKATAIDCIIIVFVHWG